MKNRMIQSVRLGLVCCLILLSATCTEYENVELNRDYSQGLANVLAACGIDRLSPVTPQTDELSWLMELWHDEYADLLGVSDTFFDQAFAVTGISYLDSVLQIDYYYVFDWMLVRLTCEIEVAEEIQEEALREVIRDALQQQNCLPLPVELGETEATIRARLEESCQTTSFRSACPDLQIQYGKFWYVLEEEGHPGQAAGAVNLTEGEICCDGIQSRCESAFPLR